MVQQMALQVQNPQINALAGFAAGQQHSMNQKVQSLEIAKQNLGWLAQMAHDAQGDPAKWDAGLDAMQASGWSPEMLGQFRGRADLAPMLAKSAFSAQEEVANNYNERQLEQSWQRLALEMAQAAKGPPPTAAQQNWDWAQGDPAKLAYLGIGMPQGAMPLSDPAERAKWGISASDTRPYFIEPGKAPQLMEGAPDLATPPSPELVEVYDDTTGQPVKGMLRTGQDKSKFEPVGGTKAPTGTSLSVDPTTGAVSFSTGNNFGKTVDTGFGKAYTEIQEAALSAIGGLDTLDAMTNAMGDPSFYSGFGAQQLMDVKRAAAAFGIDPDGVTSMETFSALAKDAALKSMGGSLGAGFSNADRSFVEEQVPALANTPDGNRQLIEIQRKLAERKIEIADMAEQYVRAKGKLDGGFTTMLGEWAANNPLFDALPEAAQELFATNPQTGERLKWDGATWVPAQ